MNSPKEQIYFEPTAESVMLRFTRMSEAKSVVNQKISACDYIYDIGLASWKGLDNTYNVKYRSPKVHAYIQAHIDNYITNIPDVVIESIEDDNENRNKAKLIDIALREIDDTNYSFPERIAMLTDSFKYGAGVMHETIYKGEMKTIYVPLRDFYVDESASCFYGGNSGIERDARDCIWKRIIPYSTFEDMFQKEIEEKKLKGYELCGADFDGTLFSIREIEENKPLRENYVHIYDYYNSSLKKRIVVANNIVIKEEPLLTSMMPFVIWNYTPRTDSVWGIGVTESILSEVIQLDTMSALATESAKISMQKGLVIDGSSGLTDLDLMNLKQGGYMILPKTREERQKSVQEMVQTIQWDSVSSDFFNMRPIYEKELVFTSQIDPYGMMSGTSETATFTRSKQEAQEKRTRSTVRKHLFISERQRGMLRVELFKKYVAMKRSLPFTVEGYVIIGGDSESPIVKKDSTAVSSFSINSKVTDIDTKVKVKPSMEKEELSQEEQGRLLQFLQVVTNIKQLNPETNINLESFIERAADIAKIDKEEIMEKYQVDTMDFVSRTVQDLRDGIKVQVPYELKREDFFKRTSELFKWMMKNKESPLFQKVSLLANDYRKKGVEKANEEYDEMANPKHEQQETPEPNDMKEGEGRVPMPDNKLQNPNMNPLPPTL